ncbi:MAG: DUF2924 domain-containing protein [Desulfovibrionaceae bacterium]|nr:DUF2924 domain-containing protein [Desulfovibrionaceae bacterium]
MIAELEPNDVYSLSSNELREHYYYLFGQPTKSGNLTYLRKRIAWRIQSLKEGPLSERARNRAAAIANEADIRTSPPKEPVKPHKTRPKKIELKVVDASARDPRLPKKGVTLVRVFKGKTHEVLVQENTFIYLGKTYKSLSAVAREITGIKWNGFKFFNLEK